MERRQIGRRLSLVGARTPRAVGYGAVGSMMFELSRDLQRISQVEMEKQAVKVEEEAARKGSLYASSTDLAEINLPQGDSRAALAYRRAAVETARNKADLLAREQINRLKQGFRGRPVEFRSTLQQSAGEFLGGLPEEIRDSAAMTYDRLGADAFDELDEQRRNFERDEALAVASHSIDALKADASRAAYDGNLEDAAAAVEASAQLLARLGPQEMGGAGVYSLTEVAEQARAMKRAMERDFLVGYGERQGWSENTARRLRNGTGDEVIDRIVGDMTAGEIDTVASKIESLTGQNERKRKLSIAQATTDRLFSEFTVEADALEAARDIADPDIRDAVVSRVERRFAERDRLNNDRLRQLSDAASRHVMVEGGSLDDLDPDVIAQMDPGSLAALQKVEADRARGTAVKTDVLAWSQLERMKSMDPDAFKRVNLAEYADRLSTSDFQKMASDQTELLAGKDDRKWTEARNLNQQIDDTLRMMDIDPTPKEGSNDAEKAASFRRLVQENITAWEEANPDKVMDPVQRQKLMDMATLEITTGEGWFGNKKGRAFEAPGVRDLTMTENDVFAIMDMLEANGVDVDGMDEDKLAALVERRFLEMQVRR